MTSELDIFVGNTTLIDEDVYRLWLDGYSVSDAVALRVRSGILEQTGATAAVLQSDTMDHYRTFHMLERLLHAPPKLLHQLIFQIPPSRQALLIERYYAFDEAFVREVLGKKLSKGTKKDLDDISTKTGITLKSCRRQFDNFKRVFKVVEEMRGSLVDNIQQHFLLSDRLARDYAAIVFFANNRFETGKKKLQYLSFGDFAFCAELMIQNWTLGAVGEAPTDPDSQVDDMDVDLDKEFLQDLKELKVLVADKDLLDLHKSLVCTALRGKLGVFSEMEANFKNLSRGLVNVAAKLTHNKDVRDLFVDLVEKFVEPCRSDHWPLNDVRLFLNQYSASVHSLDGFRHPTLWDRYMGTLRGCLLRLYHD
ncbi:acidic fibroblast growth factor intracellular-binding protein isoform X1 [Ictidomys tridecemlineatus]|uniref:acidic fibroblast growth factor intracellular-binding protein isoform X1 n=2 Tax=Marmota flaviventris TaxID=93162 RepID=UPI00025DA0BD|nr:acidic fibroblast growth factor intracellular-binding protein isoform X1 [Marmota flaviventris]XP_048663616.1 acidic fibroblast growth factor intracellular-binding protein isoform X1 [Marmota marmota marmota]KAI6053971.1 FIBP [Marmota monax]KAI6065904.1 FIBP [Marmota monax]